MPADFLPPRKSLGQNFLQDPNIIRNIVGALALKEGDQVVEVGPGRGALTNELLAAPIDLTVIEFDRDLAQYWRQREHAADCVANLKVIEGDVLDVDFTEALATEAESKAEAEPHRPVKLVGNLPYHISSPILLHLREHAALFERAVVMLQKEVVDRLAASPGSKTYGRLSVVLQQAFAVTSLFDVSKGAFFPPPKVTSAVAELVPHNAHPLNDTDAFSDLVKTAFSQRRKTLRNNVKNTPYLAQLEALKVDLTRRAETLSVDEFVALANHLTATTN